MKNHTGDGFQIVSNKTQYDSPAMRTESPDSMSDGEEFMVTSSEIEHICDGTHCEIYRAHFKGKPVIIKALRETSTRNTVVMDEFKVELKILKAINHPNLVQYISTAASVNRFESSQKQRLFAFIDRPYFVLEELVGGILSKNMSKPRHFNALPFTEAQVFRMCREFAAALNYLHAEFDKNIMIIHRDLKPDNVGFTADGTLKLFDFNLSVMIERKGHRDDIYTLTGGTGSRRYMAPEVALEKPYNEKVDQYAYGMIMYYIISGVTPFSDMKTAEEMHTKVTISGSRPSLIEDDYGRKFRAGSQMRDLIAQLWDADYRRRPSAAAALEIITQSEEAYLKKQNSKGVFSKAIGKFFGK